jgi:DNA adenine methylase
MSEGDHEHMLTLAKQHAGNVLVSGYDSDLYNDHLQGWGKVTWEHYTMTTSTTGKTAMECLWVKRMPKHEQLGLW